MPTSFCAGFTSCRRKTEDTSTKLEEVLQYPFVQAYLRKYWLPCVSMWADHGRKFFHENSNSNNLTEVC
ncbi:hypothetical protein J4Q44_G00132400 [Coregonus suidteri]|uniref:Uncharacterized protein n=1 Tax=Coregonus suidteri TaxID=861788 RepID=A0AAN8M2I5_9TELE